MSYQDKLRSEINDKLIAAMSVGHMPWVKPWSAAKNTGHPANALRGKLYRGVNTLLLHLAGFNSRWWGTYRQWQALGGQVRKGEKGTKIIFWKPIKRTLDGIAFSTVESAYQAAKTLDVDQRRRIGSLAKPGQAKRYGRKLKVREDWEEVKLSVMENLLRQKFAHADLRQKLLDTGNAYLEESNPWRDFFWGVCDGKGENHLGRLLMQIRDDLRE